MRESLLSIYGPARAQRPLVLDSPHSGRHFPADFGAIVGEHALRDGEDCFVDELWRPATERGVPLLVAHFSRTYLDPNRHAGDIDLDLVEGGAWPDAYQPSGKAQLGKALVWRTLDDGQPIYDRRLSVDELRGRIARCHQPYHAALRGLLDSAFADFGAVWHINCHSMNAVAGSMGERGQEPAHCARASASRTGPACQAGPWNEGGAGKARADIVLGDRDGSTCAPEFTAFVRDTLAARGYRVAVNDPYKGVELVRAYAAPAAGRHSLQLEVNKRLYMDEATCQPHAGFARLQADLMGLVDGLCERFAPGRVAG